MTPVMGDVASKAMSVVRDGLGETSFPISFTGRAGNTVDLTPGTTNTRSGFRVSHDAAMRIAGVWIANTFLADEIASLPARLIQRDDKRRTPQRPSNASALWEKPNTDQTMFGFLATLSMSLTLAGNAFGQLAWTNGGALRQIWPVDPNIVTIERHADSDDPAAPRELVLKATGFGELHNRPGERPEFMHVPLLVPAGGLVSMSPVRYAAELIGEGAAHSAASARLAGQGFRPSAVLTVDAEIDDPTATRIANRLQRLHSGPNSGQVAVVGGKDVKLQPLTMSLADAESVARFAQIFDVLMAIWRVPPTVAGMANKTSSWGSGVAEFTRGVERFTLRPLMRRFEAAFDEVLRWVDADLTLRFKPDALLAASPVERANVQRLSLQSGTTSMERVLAQNDEAPFDDDETVMFPLNMVTREAQELVLLRSRAEVYGALIRAGVTPEAAAEAAGLGDLEHTGAPPVAE